MSWSSEPEWSAPPAPCTRPAPASTSSSWTAGPVAGGTTGAGEGNLLVSDKEPGPELDLALLSARLWARTGPEELGEGRRVRGQGRCRRRRAPAGHWPRSSEFAAGQRAAGVERRTGRRPTGCTTSSRTWHPGFAGGVHYPQDAQVDARPGRRPPAARLRTRRLLTGRDGDRGACAGPAARCAACAPTGATSTPRPSSTRPAPGAARWPPCAGVPPARPARGAASSWSPSRCRRRSGTRCTPPTTWPTSPATRRRCRPRRSSRAPPPGPVLIGASRERVGFDRTFSLPALRRAGGGRDPAVPVPRRRPGDAHVPRLPARTCPTTCPAIGPDPRVPGLLHACGHEGAGIGLATGTGHADRPGADRAGRPTWTSAPFRPDRFTEEAA